MPNDFHGSRNDQPHTSNVVPVSNNVNAIKGTTEALLTNPNPARYRRVVMKVEGTVASDDFHFRLGDYTELTYNNTTDVDDAQDTIVITDVEDRMWEVGLAGVLVFGPVQIELAAGIKVDGIDDDTNYWVAKPLDAGVATDEVAFYLTEAEANAASTEPAEDDRIDLTGAVGTSTFAGMANNGLDHAALVTTTDGYMSMTVDNGQTAVCAAPDQMTVVGSGANAVLLYYFVP